MSEKSLMRFKKLLRPGALPDSFLSGEQPSLQVPPFEPVRRLRRGNSRISLQWFDSLMEVFWEKQADERQKSSTDAWLAPRLHAALRLTRREAADPRIWAYVAVVAEPAYVRWRFPGRPQGDGTQMTPPNRFVGGAKDSAFSRLWWTAEMFRNGPDYTPVEEALSGMQDIPNGFLGYNCFEHRPLAVGAIQLIKEAVADESVTDVSDFVQEFGRSVNQYLGTFALDAAVPYADEDSRRYNETWVRLEEPDPVDATDRPVGPDDTGVSSEDLDRIKRVLRPLIERVESNYAASRQSP